MFKKILFLTCGIAIGISVSAQHTVVLKSGDKFQGTVRSLNNGVIELEKNQTISKINLSEVSSIEFSNQGDKGLIKEIGEKQLIAGSYMIRYKVADRIIDKAPRVDNMTQKKGTVVVNISINKYGNVIKAVPGGEGSTTNDEYLYTKAKQAAESAMFNKVPTAPLEQTGFMIISF